MANKLQFTDYLQKEYNHLLRLGTLDVPQQYEKMMIQNLLGNYDDINDYINIQKALTRIMELNNENIEQCTKL